MTPILDLTPVGRYADGSPCYRFHTSFPSRNVRMVGPVCTCADEALGHGREFVRGYQASDPFGNMGEVLGVAAVDGGYRAVINTYHSNT